MCRNITELRGLEPPATSTEIRAAAEQFVRKVSGVAKPPATVAARYQAEPGALRAFVHLKACGLVPTLGM